MVTTVRNPRALLGNRYPPRITPECFTRLGSGLTQVHLLLRDPGTEEVLTYTRAPERSGCGVVCRPGLLDSYSVSDDFSQAGLRT